MSALTPTSPVSTSSAPATTLPSPVSTSLLPAPASNSPSPVSTSPLPAPATTSPIPVPVNTLPAPVNTLPAPATVSLAPTSHVPTSHVSPAYSSDSDSSYILPPPLSDSSVIMPPPLSDSSSVSDIFSPSQPIITKQTNIDKPYEDTPESIKSEIKEDEEIDKVINLFYKLKAKYDDNRKKYITKILNNKTLSTRDKKQQIAKYKSKCINCRELGGTIFTRTDTEMKAVCGNTSSPCTLNIHIKYYPYLDLSNIISTEETDITKEKENIIKLKMDYLCKYIEEIEDYVFENQKRKLEEDYTNYHTYLNELRNIENNKITKEKLLNQNENIQYFISQIKDIIKDDNNSNKYKEVVKIYETQLKPLLDDNLYTKYKKNAIEYNNSDNTYNLIQKKILYTDTFVEYDVPEVISNISNVR